MFYEYAKDNLRSTVTIAALFPLDATPEKMIANSREQFDYHGTESDAELLNRAKALAGHVRQLSWFSEEDFVKRKS